MKYFLYISLVFHIVVIFYALRMFLNSRKMRKDHQKTRLQVVGQEPKNTHPVSDPEALKNAEKQIAGHKSLLNHYADQDYFVVRTLGSSSGFSSTYVYEILAELKEKGFRAEVIESNGSLVAMETANFLRYQILAHVDDADAVRNHLNQLFS